MPVVRAISRPDDLIRIRRHSLIAASLLLMLSDPPQASAGSILDYIRSYDLNDYALGFAVSTIQSPYIGGEPTRFAYPYLTSFRHDAFTDDWLIIREGNLGARWVGKSGWVLGVVGRLQFSGTGSAQVDELLGVDDRKWTVEVAPLVGYRSWPVHLDYRIYKEVFDRHDGLTSEFTLSYPTEGPWGHLVPAVRVIRFDGSYTGYYFGVSPTEATPSIPVYEPGAATNLELRLNWGYALTEKWLLSGHIASEWLDSSIKDSPLIDQDQVWSVNIGAAYNADVFRSREYGDDTLMLPGFEFRVGAFRNSVDTTIRKDGSDGSPSREIDVEDILGVDDQRSVMQVDAIARINPFHRLEFGHFELGRHSSTTLATDITFGDETFTAGTVVDTRVETRVSRISYGFSLMNDAQKELGVMGGVHVSRAKIDMSSGETGQTERSEITAPLPVVGVYGHVFLGDKMLLAARLHVFRMQFDNYEGSLNYAYLGLQRFFGDNFGVGLGYNYYSMNLDSRDADVNGSIRVIHRGPIVFLSAFF